MVEMTMFVHIPYQLMMEHIGVDHGHHLRPSASGRYQLVHVHHIHNDNNQQYQWGGWADGQNTGTSLMGVSNTVNDSLFVPICK